MEWSIEGKTVAITGATAGIGRATALGLARRGARLRLLGRWSPRAEALLEELATDAEFITCDLSSLSSVEEAVEVLLAEPLHVVIANAGVAGRWGVTADGFELAFGVNHVGHHALVTGVIPRLVESAPSRVVVVSSHAHHGVARIELDRLTRRTRSLTSYPEYRVSKLANLLFVSELARRLQGTGVTTYAVHPGMVKTGMWRRLPQPFRWWMFRKMVTPEVGARTSIWCATEPALATETGGYYARMSPARISQLAGDPAAAAELWDRTERWIAERRGKR